MARTTWRHLRQLFGVGFLVLLIAAPSSIDAQSQRSRVPRLEPSACPFEQGPALAGSKIECSWLVVAESREKPNSREIRLPVAVIRGRTRGDAVPLVMLHGGPGESGFRNYPTRAIVSTWGSGRRDVVIYDQRGGGLAEPKLCPEYGIALDEARVLPAGAAREDRRNRGARECIASLKAQGVDPAAYSTIANALDLVELRKTLGYAYWDVYAGSYGTKVAQEAMVRDGGAIRAAVLLWPVMRGSGLQAEVGSALQGAMERVFRQCATQPPCHAAFPDPRADFYADYEELDARPLIVPRANSKIETLRLDGQRLVDIISNLVLRQPARISQLPLLLHEMRSGDRMRAATTLGSFVSTYEGPQEGGVVNPLIRCFDAYSPEAVSLNDSLNEMLPAPYRTDNFRDCPIWQERFASTADRIPVVSDIPTLIVSAEFDERTPTENGRRIAATLSRATVIELPNIGHGTVPPPIGRCLDGLIARFFENPLALPDASCVGEIPRLQFVTGWRE